MDAFKLVVTIDLIINICADMKIKSMIVELYKTGRSVNDLWREYVVSEVTIYKWIKQFSLIALIDDIDGILVRDYTDEIREILCL